MQTWEYKTIKVETKGVFGGILDENEFEEQLNQLAEHGWELVASFDTSQTYDAPREAVAGPDLAVGEDQQCDDKA